MTDGVGAWSASASSCLTRPVRIRSGADYFEAAPRCGIGSTQIIICLVVPLKHPLLMADIPRSGI